MREIFLDVNVLLDVLGKREPSFQDSMRVWSLCEKGLVKGYVSAVSFNIVYYITRRMADRLAAKKNVTVIRDIFSIVASDEQVIGQAIDSEFGDFEDGIQYFSAVRCNADCIITRNKKDFRRSDVPVLSPEEFLSIYQQDSV